MLALELTRDLCRHIR